jgi:hypothetical protein
MLHRPGVASQGVGGVGVAWTEFSSPILPETAGARVRLPTPRTIQDSTTQEETSWAAHSC